MGTQTIALHRTVLKLSCAILLAAVSGAPAKPGPDDLDAGPTRAALFGKAPASTFTAREPVRVTTLAEGVASNSDPLATYAALDGDCSGNDLLPWARGNNRECEKACDERTDCKGYTRHVNNQACILKSKSCTTPTESPYKFHKKPPPTKGEIQAFLKKAGYSGSAESLPQETMLDMRRRQLSALDMRILAHLINSGSLGNLEELVLYSNQIGDAGMKAFAEAIASRSLASLTVLDLGGNQIGDKGMKAFAAASGSLGTLTHLFLARNQIGDPGMADFSRAIASGWLPNLKYLWLNSNKIGDTGMTELYNPIALGLLPALQNAYMSGNQGSDAPIKEALAKRKQVVSA